MLGVPRFFSSLIHVVLGPTGDAKDIARQSASLRADALNCKFVPKLNLKHFGKVFQIFPESTRIYYGLSGHFIEILCVKICRNGKLVQIAKYIILNCQKYRAWAGQLVSEGGGIRVYLSE